MAIEQINLGTVVQEGADGDVARVAFTKVNANFADLESRKVEKVTGKQLSTEDYTSAEKMKLGGIESGAQVNTVTSVAGKTGAVALVKGDVGLGNVDNTSDANKPVSTATQTALNLKANASTQIIAGTGLTGGGTLDTNRTLTVSYGTTAGTAAQGNDSRLSDAREWSAETVAQAEAEAGTATTRRAWTAQRVRQAIAAWWNGVSSAWGRSFVASADAAAGRTALGLGNAATRAVQSSPTDTTDGALMAVGAFGLGGVTLPSLTNLDDRFTRPGFYICIVATDAPSPYGVVHIIGNVPGEPTLTWVHQVFYDTAGEVYERFSTNLGAWSPWRRMYHTGSILGTVSQSGGVPTGAIIERGSNANGEYVKYADGTQICTNHSFAIPGRTIVNGSLFRTGDLTWTFPANFINNPVCGGKPTYGESAANGWYGLGNTADGSPTSTVFTIHGAASATNGGTAMLFAIGRWY